MKGCPDCEKRSLWAYRTYRVHAFIVKLPVSGNAGSLFNFSIRNFIRYIAFKFVLGNISSLWYQSVLKEGKRVHDIARAKSRKTSSTTLPRV